MHHFVIDDLFCPNLLLAIAICRKNEKKKTEELSRANLENATFANLLLSRVSTSFALNLFLSIYIFATYFLGANFISAYTFFSFSAKTAIIARSNNSHNFVNYFNNSF